MALEQLEIAHGDTSALPFRLRVLVRLILSGVPALCMELMSAGLHIKMKLNQ